MVSDMVIVEAVGIGIILSFLFTELTGLAAGLIVPGYLAFFWNNPYRIAVTFIIALITYLLLQFLSRYIIIYSQRRFMAAVLIGYIIGWILEVHFLKYLSFEEDLRAVGYIIPGLIANNMIRQGVFKTISVTLLVSILVRLFVLLLIG